MVDTPTARCMGPYTVPSSSSSSSSETFYLTPVHFSDVPEMVRLLNINQDVYNGSALFQYPYLESHAQERIQRAHDTMSGPDNINTHFALRLGSPSPTSPLIGWTHLHFEHYSDKHPQPKHPVTHKPLKVIEIGYWLSPEQTGKGYATRMANFVVQKIVFGSEAEGGMGCDIVRAVSYVENMGSRKVAERTGMKLEMESKMIWIPKLQTEEEVCCYAAHLDPATEGIKKEDYDY